MNTYPLVRKIYLYSFALIGLVLVTFGGVRLVELGLKTFILTKADISYEYPIMQRPTMQGNYQGGDYQGPTEEQQKDQKKQMEEYQKNQKSAQRQRDAAKALAMIIIGLPLYLYHWLLIGKDSKEVVVAGN